MGTTNNFDDLVNQKIEEAKDISLTSLEDNKINPLLTVNELVKTRTELHTREAELKQKAEDAKLKKLDSINECAKTAGGIAGSIFGTLAFAKLFKELLAFEESGHMVTSGAGRTLIGCLKFFKK